MHPRRCRGWYAAAESPESGMRPRVVDVFASGTHATFLRLLQPQKPLSRAALRGDSPDSHPLNREKTQSLIGKQLKEQVSFGSNDGTLLGGWAEAIRICFRAACDRSARGTCASAGTSRTHERSMAQPEGRCQVKTGVRRGPRGSTRHAPGERQHRPSPDRRHRLLKTHSAHAAMESGGPWAAAGRSRR